MKSFVYAMVAASALSIPLASFAQSADNGPVTRAQVRSELAQLRQAGYNPGRNDPYYPDDYQAAARRVQQGSAVAAGNTSGYGGAVAGSVRSGVAAQPVSIDDRSPSSIFFGR